MDPSVIPLGSIVFIEGYGYAICDDIGGAIHGNIIDVGVDTLAQAYQVGNESQRQSVSCEMSDRWLVTSDLVSALEQEIP